jgi:hypothetical protein
MNRNILQKISSSRQISMERAFNGSQHKSIKGVALHVGVPSPLARAFLLHLIKTNQLPGNNRFAQRLKTRK